MTPFAVGRTSSDLKSIDDSSAYLPWFLSAVVAGCLSELTLRTGVVLNMGVSVSDLGRVSACLIAGA